MRHHINYEKPQLAYKIPNPTYPQQLSAFLSQSKHQKQQQFSQINQYMVEQFIHLFEICNINRFIDYNEQFLNEVRNVILRLQIVQKKLYEFLDQKDDYVYLIVEGRVKKTPRHKPIPCKRVSKNTTTGFDFHSHSFMSNFNPRSSHQTFHNIQLKQFEKTLILDRNSRMSLVKGNLWNQMIASPKKKSKLQEKNTKNFSSFRNQHLYQGQSSTKKAYFNNFQEETSHQKENQADFQQFCSNENRNQYKTQFLQPSQEELYQCITQVKYIKLLKWSYDQLVQYVFKYQNDNLINFLSKTLSISQNDIKFHQVYNKTSFLFYPVKQSNHSNTFIGFEKGSLYILRKGSVELKYQSKCPFPQNQNCVSPSSEKRKNPYLAQHVNKPQVSYKKVVLNEGAIICPQLQEKSFYIQSLQDVVFLQIDRCLLQILKQELKNKWWSKKLAPSYKKIKKERYLYMKEEFIEQKEQKKQLKMTNVTLQSQSAKHRSKNKQRSRFRVPAKVIDQNPKTQKQNLPLYTSNKQNNQQDFGSEEFKQFISYLPYEIMIKSKEKISLKLQQKAKARNVSSKVVNYLKKNQKGSMTQKQKNKLFELKMKNIVSKQIGSQNLAKLYKDISNNEGKKQFHKNLNSNWFKEDSQISSDPTVQQKIVERASIVSNGLNKNLLTDKKLLDTYKSSTNLGRNQKNGKESTNKLTLKSILSSKTIEKKVTFNKDQKQVSSQSEEIFCNDDTGIINKFVKDSHNYQKEITFLINSSQREEQSQMKSSKKIKSCKTEGNNVIFSHNMINDILKRVNNPNKKSTNLSNINSQRTLLIKSKTQLVQDMKQKQQQIMNSEQIVNQGENRARQTEANNCSSFQQIFSQIVQEKNQINNQNQTFVLKNKEQSISKDKKTNSLTNHTTVRSSSSKAFKYYNIQSADRKRTSINLKDKNNTWTQSGFLKSTEKRPFTAQIAQRQECKSLFFNQWIDTEAATIDSHRNSELGVGNYNFCGVNMSFGDRKIWKRLKSGKIVKKSVNFYNKKNATILSPQHKKQTNFL